MESKSKLKQQLTRFFIPSKLLHNSPNSTSSSPIFTSSSSPNTGSTRSDDPLFVTDNVKAYKLDQPLLSNSSLPSSKTFSFDLTRICKPNKHSQNKDVVANVNNKIERRVRESGEFYETGGRKEGQICPPSSPFDSLYHVENVEEQKEKIDIKKKVVFRNAYGFCSSSENDESGFFSSDEVIDDENETETFFSSRSFYSSDSLEFYTRPTRSKNKSKNRRKITQSSRKRRIANSNREKKVVTGIPVIKKSNDPYVDFRDSMLEMIIERQIFGDKDLEKLVSSYISLNPPLYHSVILRAFADISNVLFGY